MRIDEVQRNKLNKYKFDKAYKNMVRERRSDNFARVGVVFRLVFIVLIIILFIRIFWRLRGVSNDLSFTAFLDFLSNLNSVDVSINVADFSITDDWGIFNFFRDFLNPFAQLIGVIVWLFSNIVNLISYVLQFLLFLFR